MVANFASDGADINNQIAQMPTRERWCRFETRPPDARLHGRAGRWTSTNSGRGRHRISNGSAGRRSARVVRWHRQHHHGGDDCARQLLGGGGLRADGRRGTGVRRCRDWRAMSAAIDACASALSRNIGRSALAVPRRWRRELRTSPAPILAARASHHTPPPPLPVLLEGLVATGPSSRRASAKQASGSLPRGTCLRRIRPPRVDW